MKLVKFSSNKWTSDTHFTVSDESFDLVKNQNWCVCADLTKRQAPHYFIMRKSSVEEQKSGWPVGLKLHRYILGLKLGNSKLVVDHINGWLDNSLKSLRITDNKNNSRYREKNANKKLPKGVSLHRDGIRYRSAITVDGNRIWLGLHGTIESATKAYNQAATLYFGEFAKLT